MPEKSFLNHTKMLHFVSALLERLLIMSAFFMSVSFVINDG